MDTSLELLNSLEERVRALEAQVGAEATEPVTNDLVGKFKNLNKLIEEHDHVKNIWANCMIGICSDMYLQQCCGYFARTFLVRYDSCMRL
eukprot:m.110386 g.110386  ORF g.110386 m.110386 type:complete len:90 (+) comp9219_c4_seq2:69-338(+)